MNKLNSKTDIDELLSSNESISKENEILLEKLKKEALEKSLLLEINKKISSSLNVQEVLDLIIDLLKQVIPYDAAGIFLVNNETKKIYPAALRGYDKHALKKAQLKVGRGLIGVVTREGKGLLCPDITKEPRYVDARQKTKSEIIVPLIVRKKLLGAVNLESNHTNAFTEEHLNLLTAFASNAAIAIDNARLHEEVLKTKELEFDLFIARKIQKALLPKVLPKVEGYDFATLNIPSKTVSGDLYDLARLNNGRLGITIGDVSGKGTPAAILMASIYASYKGILNEPMPVSKKMSRLNEIMCDTALSGTYVTMFYAELNTEKRCLTYCNAGHFPPVIIRQNKEVHKLSKGGIILGFLKNAPYEEATINLNPGDILFSYTDGLVESRNRRGIFFSLEEVIKLIHNNVDASADDLKDKIYNQIRQFIRRKNFEDDLTFVIMKSKMENEIKRQNSEKTELRD